MNYLAHAALAEPQAHSLIGNLAGDHVKGPLDSHALHPWVAAGVRRHRTVDGLTDRHPAYALLRGRFPRRHRRYAGIVLDVPFDGEYHDRVPASFAALVPRWVAADWLRVYATVEGVDAVLERLATRLREPAALRASWAAVRDERESLREGFRTIFTDVRSALDSPRAPPA